MKKFVFFIVVIGIILIGGHCFAADKPINFPIKELYSSPAENSQLVFTIPIDVRLLDTSKDGNWYKVKIAFNIGPLAYSYVGWANIPLQDLLNGTSSEAAEVSSD